MSGRPQFDESVVLDAAIEVFRRHGYAGTSIQDLIDATGLSRSSIYNRFGDKDGLYREALEIYGARAVARMIDERPSARGRTNREKLEAGFRSLLRRAQRAETTPVCFIVRSCADLAALPSDSQELALHATRQQQRKLVELLDAALTSGELAIDTDTQALAWYFLGIYQAVTNLSVVGAPVGAMEAMIDTAMEAWPEPQR